jgi:hypothetical protein
VYSITAATAYDGDMTPPRSSLAALAAAIGLAGAVAAAAPGDGSPNPITTCEVGGWTAYVPLDEAEEISRYLELCADDGPPPGWPPGAQSPAGHPEIQVIR